MSNDLIIILATALVALAIAFSMSGLGWGEAGLAAILIVYIIPSLWGDKK